MELFHCLFIIRKDYDGLISLNFNLNIRIAHSKSSLEFIRIQIMKFGLEVCNGSIITFDDNEWSTKYLQIFHKF